MTYPELIANVPEVEAQWFRRTGIYPIHGLIVVKDEHIKRYPWLARSLMDAFVTAKQPYLEQLERIPATARKTSAIAISCR